MEISSGITAVTTPGAVLGRVLVQLRTAKEMKQAELAAAIGLGASTWSRIEKGDSGLSVDQLRQVAKVLGVTPGVILDLVDAGEKEVLRQGMQLDSSSTSLTSISKGASTNNMEAMAKGALKGAAIGTVIPIFGTALGLVIGGVIGALMDEIES